MRAALGEMMCTGRLALLAITGTACGGHTLAMSNDGGPPILESDSAATDAAAIGEPDSAENDAAAPDSDAGCAPICLDPHVLELDEDAGGAPVGPYSWLAVPLDLGITVASTSVGFDGHGWNKFTPPFRVTTLSACGTLNEAESAANLDSYEAGAPRDIANVRRVVLRTVSPTDGTATMFCTGWHQAAGGWVFQPGPVSSVQNATAGLMIGESLVSENGVDMLAVIFNRDAVLRSIEYDTSP
jgi:hypothetical protein